MARRALLVGINDYRGISDLHGCVNDVTNMRDVLRSYLGFTNKEIRVATDARATKAGILSRLDWLVKGAKAGDFLVFHYSGHGSQIRDRDGDELEDGMDELICPHDFDWDGTYILDDDLNAIFKTLPKGVLLEVFLDSCHSGTGLRDVDFGRPADLGPAAATPASVPRYLPPPVDILCRHEGEEDELKQIKLFDGLRDAKEAVHHILWAGCHSDQTSADAYIDNTYNGAFTYYFCYHMRRSNGQLSRKELLSRIRASLRHGEYSQVPQLETEATVRAARALTAPERKVKK
ncbi:MAG: caspase family protein [Gallionellaceae bacterium]|nr:caspase family protein [Gallionellaceae bacterium]